MSDLEVAKLIAEALWKGTCKDYERYIREDVEISSPVLDYVSKKSNSIERLKAVTEYWKRAFSDIKSAWTSVKEDNNGNIEFSWSAYATHTGEDFMGIPAKSIIVKYSGSTTYTIENSRLVRYKAEVDVEKIKKQIS